jgi:hypothetical protein
LGHHGCGSLYDRAAFGPGAGVGYPPIGVKLELIDDPVSAKGVEFLGLNVRGVEGLAVPGVSVMVKDHLAIEAVKGYVWNVGHGLVKILLSAVGQSR